MRSCRILHILIFALTTLTSLAQCLSGDHVCTRLVNQTLTLRETYTEPVVVQTFTWCLQVPPRCAKTRMENRERFRIKTVIEERTVSECCEGYVMQEFHVEAAEAEPKCIPFCKSCENGLCVTPNLCKCEPGYQGDSCAHECPPGSWGRQCMEECDCALGGSCNPVNGICECPAGWQGPGCKLPCPVGRWGFRCESVCDCGGRLMGCNQETGNCHTGKIDDKEVALSGNWTKGDLFRSAVEVSGFVSSVSSSPSEENTGSDVTLTDTKDYSVTRVSRTTEHAQEERLQTVSEIPEDFGPVKPEFPVPDLADVSSTIRSEDTTTSMLSDDEIFRRNDDDENDVGAKVVKIVGPPHPSYVKTMQKAEQVPQLSHDTTVLIVVGSVVSVCLTTLAVLMVFYLRSKAFETIPMSIYDNDKNEGDDQVKGNTIRSLKITNTTLPPLPTFVNPVFATNPETALITFDAAELNKHYDNRTGTISIRVSGNIRDLLESHYDRPPAATCRRTVDQNAEHVYDEIPLSTPLCVRKDDLVP